MSCNLCEVQELAKTNRRKNVKDLFLTFMITNDCNFRCTYCFETNKEHKYLSEEDALIVVDKMFDFKDNTDYWKFVYDKDNPIEHIHLGFFGGEPLLNSKLIEKILDRFVDNCKKDLSKYENRLNSFTSSIITNGSLLKTKDTIHLLDKYHKNISMNITFEGSKNFHDSCRKTIDGKGTYDLVKENMLWFRDTYKQALHPKITLTPFNIKYLYECYAELKKLGIKHIYIKPVLDSNLWNKQHERIAEEQFKLIVEDMLKPENSDIDYVMFNIGYNENSLQEIINPGCGVGRGSITLNADGDFYPCYEFTTLTQKEEDAPQFVLGNAKTGITNYGNDLMKTKMLNWIDKKKLVDDDCKTCNMTTHCTACVGNNYKFTHDFSDSVKWHCKIQQIQSKWGLIYHYLKNKGATKYE